MSWLETLGAPGGALAGTVAAICCAGAALAMVVGIFAGVWLVWLGAALLVAASIWNLLPAPKPATGGI